MRVWRGISAVVVGIVLTLSASPAANAAQGAGSCTLVPNHDASECLPVETRVPSVVDLAAAAQHDSDGIEEPSVEWDVAPNTDNPTLAEEHAVEPDQAPGAAGTGETIGDPPPRQKPTNGAPENEPAAVTDPEGEAVTQSPAHRSLPLPGSCGFIRLPDGLDAVALADIMSTATTIPVSSDGVRVTGYVVHHSFQTDIGNGPYEQHQIQIYIVPDLSYDSESVLSKTHWSNGHAPYLDPLFAPRSYVIDLGALLATPEFFKAGATDLTFNGQGDPGFDVTIGDDLTISSALFQSFMIQSGHEQRPLVNALVAVAPLPAQCDAPTADPEPSSPQAEAAKEPTSGTTAPTRSVPQLIQTGVGLETATEGRGPSMLSFALMGISLLLIIGALTLTRRGA